MKNHTRKEEFLCLTSQASLKHLERPYLYHIGRDELYEIDEKAEAFLARCDGTLQKDEIRNDEEFVEYCIEEGLLEVFPESRQVPVRIDKAPFPSLRYLELQLLHQCNLRCRHCYLGPPRNDKLSLDDALKITEEFAAHGGLRLLISGGEPLLYPFLKEFITKTSTLKIRRVLLTNGTMVNEKTVSWLKVDNIQVSLDGWRDGHTMLRGKGSFEQTIRGIRCAQEKNIPISIATMIHRGNAHEFEQLKSFVDEIEATEWGIDVLCMAGFLTHNHELILPYKKAAPLMKYAYGGGYHGATDGFACGRHLMTVLPTGKAVKCGFYENSPLGDAREGLIDCWLKLHHISLDELECKGCPVINECAGGCRFRAPSVLAPDPVMCNFYSLTPP